MNIIMNNLMRAYHLFLITCIVLYYEYYAQYYKITHENIIPFTLCVILTTEGICVSSKQKEI